MKNKKNIFTLCLVLTEILIFAFLFLPIVEISIEQSPYIFINEKYNGFDIINGKTLTTIHSIALIIEIVFIVLTLIFVGLFFTLKNKKILTFAKISTFFQLVASFFFLMTFNFVGFVLEAFIVSSYVFVLLIQHQTNTEYENEHSGFKNTVFGLILMILLFLIIGMDGMNIF